MLFGSAVALRSHRLRVLQRGGCGSRAWRKPLSLLAVASFVASFCVVGIGSSVAWAGGGTLTVAMDAAFTGGTAIDGIAEAAGCYPAVRVVNDAGGVLGHKIQCSVVDTRGDPSDAIPATEKMLATTSTLVAVLGPESSTATAIAPILERAHITMITQNGLSLYTRNKNPYFWRNYPADDIGGAALAYWAVHKGLKHGALLFDNTVAAQSSVPALIKAYKALGGKIVINLKVSPDSTSYGAEIHRLLQAKPDVIFTESDPQTDATAFRNLLELGKAIPIYGTNATVIPDWLKDVTKALGKADMAKYYRGVEPYAPTFPGTKTFNREVMASIKQVPTAKTWIGQEYATTPYDGVVIICLAMTEAHSTTPSKFNKDILKVTAPGKGKKIVYSYKQGVAALKAGKKIQYIGASGPTIFNKHHDAFGEYGVYRYVHGNLKLVGKISAATLAKLPS